LGRDADVLDGEALVALVEGDADEDRAGSADEAPAAGPSEHTGGGLVRAAGALAGGSEEDRNRECAHCRIADATRHGSDASHREAVATSFWAVSEEWLGEPPERVSTQADCDGDEERVAENPFRDSLVKRQPSRHEGLEVSVFAPKRGPKFRAFVHTPSWDRVLVVSTAASADAAMARADAPLAQAVGEGVAVRLPTAARPLRLQSSEVSAA
jgi:hypothetical protein